MHIFINDVATECPENSTILQVLTQQDISPLNIAIALDNTVVPKAQWETTLVRDGSQLLIIKAYITKTNKKYSFHIINNQYIKIRI